MSRKKNKQGKATVVDNANSTTATLVKKRKEVEVAYKPQIHLSDALLEKVDYLHAKVNKGLEWSAILVYSTQKGSIDTVDKNWDILVEDLILMDIGTPGYTEYDIKPDDDYATELWQDALEKGKKLGHIHTHHRMPCYFSGVDTQELHDNAPHHNYYLSLIVNYDDMDKWCAKVAVCGEEKTNIKMETTTSWKGAAGDKTLKKKENVEETNPLLFLMKCDIDAENPEVNTAPVGLEDRVEEILEEKKKKASSATTLPQATKNSSHTGKEKGSTTSIGFVPNAEQRGKGLPYSAAAVEDPEEIEWTGTILDLQGNPMVHSDYEVQQEENYHNTASRGTVVQRYSPRNMEDALIKILDKDMDSAKSLEEVFMALELLDDTGLEKYMKSVENVFEKQLGLFFSEELTAIHLHAISCSMFDLIKPFLCFTACDKLDDILIEFLGEDGAYNTTVIKTMTGLQPSDQMCLDTEKV